METGGNPIFIVRGVKRALEGVLDFLDEIKLPVGGDRDLMSVAMVSTNYDRKLAKIIFDAIRSGCDVIEMEPGGRESYFSLIPASRLIRGYAS